MKTRNIGIAFVASLLLSMPVSAAGGELERAVALYNKGDMKGCCDVLAIACAGSAKNNAMAHYYYANALMALHQTSEARAQYEAVLRLAPSGSLHDFANRALGKTGGVPASAGSTGGTASGGDSGRGFIGVSLMQDNEIDKVVSGSPAATAGVKAGDRIMAIDGKSCASSDVRTISRMITGPAGTAIEMEIERAGKRFKVSMKREAKVNFSSLNPLRASGGGGGGGGAPRTADALDNQMITKFRQTGDTDRIYSEVLAALAVIPRHIKEELVHSGVKVMIAPSITDCRPDLRGTRPEGYVHGGDYENCPGMYDPGTKILYIPERAQIGSAPRSVNTRADEVTLHELGHAFDHLKSHTHSSEYLSAFEEDGHHLTNTIRERYYYYTQPGRGHVELFAELFAIANGSSDTPGLDRAFPKSFEYVRSSMK